MRNILAATAAGLLVLTLTTTASAQQFGSRYSGGSYYSAPSQGYQLVYPSNVYAQPQYGSSFSYSTPSFGFAINVNPSHGSSFGVYSQPTYVPSYYPISPRPWHGHYHPHHHHHHHHHGHHHGHR